MQVSITKFRQEMFDLVALAMDGADVWVTYKGRRFRIAPEGQPTSRLARVTPLSIVNAGAEGAETSLLEEMTRAWEEDWSDL